MIPSTAACQATTTLPQRLILAMARSKCLRQHCGDVIHFTIFCRTLASFDQDLIASRFRLTVQDAATAIVSWSSTCGSPLHFVQRCSSCQGGPAQYYWQ